MRALIVFIITLFIPLAAHGVNDRILENIDTRDTADGPQIVITFNHSVRYVSHSPRNASDYFEIQMASKALTGITNEDLLGTETLQWSPSAEVPLFDISYESTVPGNSRLILRFQRFVQIKVLAGKDIRTLVIQLPKPVESAPPPEQQPPAEGEIPLSADPKTRELMETARQAVATKDYTTAIRLYEKVLREGGADIQPLALEFLGVTREKNGQKAQAKAVYQRYLAEYPDGAAAERVQQRLTGLVTAAKRAPGKLRGAKAQPGDRPAWQIFGGFSQFYRRDDQTTDLDDENEFTSVTRSSLSSDLDLSARLRTETYSVRTRFSGGYEYDFLDDGPGNEARVSTLYARFSDRKRDLHLQPGRQPGNKGGILGRFDGVLFSIGLPGETTLNLVSGYPVNSSRDNLNTDRIFYGANIDFKPFGKAWDVNAFVIQQEVEGITDRQAVGGEVRYFAPGRSFFTLTDYDLHYDELNTFLFLGNWTFPDDTTVNLSFDYRRSPLLTTSNALQGQLTESIDTLLDTFSVSEIEELAEDRTATSRLVTLGFSRPLMKDLQINGDLTISNLSGTPASGDVEATPDTDDDYGMNLQLVRSNWFKAGDIHIIGTRYSKSSTSTTNTISLNSRYPVTSKFHINPRFRIDLRKNKSDDSEQTTYRPFMRLSYKLKRGFRAEADAGGEWSNRNLTDDTDKDQSWFVNVGYRMDF